MHITQKRFDQNDPSPTLNNTLLLHVSLIIPVFATKSNGKQAPFMCLVLQIVFRDFSFACTWK